MTLNKKTKFKSILYTNKLSYDLLCGVKIVADQIIIRKYICTFSMIYLDEVPQTYIVEDFCWLFIDVGDRKHCLLE